MTTLLVILLALAALAALAGWALFLGLLWLVQEMTRGWNQILSRFKGMFWREQCVREMYRAQNQALGRLLQAATVEILRLRQRPRLPEDEADWWKEQ